MTALRDSGELILWTILAVVGLGALMAFPALIDDGWHVLLRARSRHARTPSPPPPAPTSPTESEPLMTDFRPDRDDPVTPIGGDSQAPTAEAAKLEQLEQRAVEAEAAAAKADQEALFASHDHAAMELRIGAMERELERLDLVRGLAERAAETAHDHLDAARFLFMRGKDAYELEEYAENLYTHRRWRLMEQAKAADTSRKIELTALTKAVEKMTLEVERVRETGPYREAMAKRTRKAAEAAKQRADEARAAADAAAAKAGIRKPTPAPDDSQP